MVLLFSYIELLTVWRIIPSGGESARSDFTRTKAARIYHCGAAMSGKLFIKREIFYIILPMFFSMQRFSVPCVWTFLKLDAFLLPMERAYFSIREKSLDNPQPALPV
jgi:hypothetical protein